MTLPPATLQPLQQAIKADPNRTALAACNNFVEHLPASIAQLKRLKRLIVYDNALEDLHIPYNYHKTLYIYTHTRRKYRH